MMNPFLMGEWLLRPRTPDKDAAIRNSKLAKDLGDSAFRIAQMWIVLSIVRAAYDNSHHPAAGCAFYFLIICLALYSMLATRGFILEWEASKKREGPPLTKTGSILLVVFMIYAAAPLLYFEEVVIAIHQLMNRIG